MQLKELNQNSISKLKESGIDLNEAAIETEILLNFVFGITKKDLILNPDKELSDAKLEIFNNLLKRRAEEKTPVQYLTNRAFFMGEEFYVDENVLIPRPETEILVEEVIKLTDKNTRKIVDIGTGSGCIACMLAKNITYADVFAVDISEKALKVAEINAEKLGVKDKITFVHSNLFESIDSKGNELVFSPERLCRSSEKYRSCFAKEKFDVIVSNPPYIPIPEKPNLQSEVVLHEPHLALFAEDIKGVSFYEKLAFEAKDRLVEKGILAVEIGIYQSADVVRIFKNAGFKEINIIKDYNQIERVIIAKC